MQEGNIQSRNKLSRQLSAAPFDWFRCLIAPDVLLQVELPADINSKTNLFFSPFRTIISAPKTYNVGSMCALPVSSSDEVSAVIV